MPDRARASPPSRNQESNQGRNGISAAFPLKNFKIHPIPLVTARGGGLANEYEQQEKRMSYIPTKEGDLATYATNFKDVSFANQAALGLTALQFTEIEDAANDYAAALQDWVTGKLLADGYLVVKNDQKAATVEVLRRYGQMILHNPAVSNTLKAQLGLTVTPSPFGPVQVPTNLVANGYQTGVVELRWDRAGNSKTTMFAVEARYLNDPEWTLLGNTSKTRFTSDGHAPGDQVSFRVTATRGDNVSAPSTPYILYGGSDAVPITLEAAA